MTIEGDISFFFSNTQSNLASSTFTMSQVRQCREDRLDDRDPSISPVHLEEVSNPVGLCCWKSGWLPVDLPDCVVDHPTRRVQYLSTLALGLGLLERQMAGEAEV